MNRNIGLGTSAKMGCEFALTLPGGDVSCVQFDGADRYEAFRRLPIPKRV